MGAGEGVRVCARVTGGNAGYLQPPLLFLIFSPAIVLIFGADVRLCLLTREAKLI
jgi:hypothetical protein